ncbi:MAG: ABC transporter ATP-binding protein [Candidatus Izemoplasmatales bacterium]|nr:ABC transporter ATP-binding protein [Candidatus Izemoplasmatales bacterium]
MKPIIRYFKHIYVILIPLFLSAYLSLRMAISLMNVIDSAIDGDWSAFWNHALWLMIFTLLLYIANLITHYATVNFTKSVVTKMKTDYVQAVFNKNIAEFQKDNIASYLSLVTNDFAIIETDYIEQVMIILSGCVRAITAIVIFVIVSPLVLLIGLLTLILSVVLSMFIEKPVQKHNKERSVLFSEYNSFIKEVLSALGIIKNNGLEDRIRTNFRDKSLAVQHKKYVIDKLMSFVFAGQNFIGGVVVIGIALFTVRLTIAGSVTFAGVIVVINNIDKLITPIISVSEAIPKFRSVKAIFQRLDQSLEIKDQYQESIPFHSLNQTIAFQDVSFSYDDMPVLKDVNFSLQKGQKYLIIGPSGGGKSTVLRLLRKYLNPSQGFITVDDAILKDIIKTDYFSKIAHIEQNVFLFEDTLRHNLTLFKDYSDEHIHQAIARAGLQEFVSSNPEGLEYMLYDNGKNVSGGEKSRIAIARGLLNNAEIMLLDEAFASLDYDRVKDIETTLLNLEDITLINVSHVIVPENKARYDAILMVANLSVSQE